MQEEPKTKKSIDQLDKKIGRRIHAVRTMESTSLMAASAAIGTSYQALQNVERGRNRITAGSLFQLSLFLKQPIENFFPCDGELCDIETISKRELRLIALFREISKQEQNKVFNIMRQICNAVDDKKHKPKKN